MPRGEGWRESDDARPQSSPEGDASAALAEEERAIRAAHDYFRAVPPYRITFEDSGQLCLCRKRYQFWEGEEPADGTHWVVISTHDSLEEAERRVRHITSPPVYYDARGRLAQGPPPKEEAYGMPPDDEEE